jgi:ribosome maturation factor RimP
MDLTQAAAEVLTPLRYEVLEVTVSASGRSKRVLLRIDRLDEALVTIDDVARAAEVYGLELDRLDPFPTPYRLEVESPGAQRPLFTTRHFQRFNDLLITFNVAGERLKGRVVRADETTVTVVVNGAERSFGIDEIKQARLAEWPDTPR